MFTIGYGSEGKIIEDSINSKPIDNILATNYSLEDFEGYTIGQPIMPGGTAANPPPGSPSGTLIPSMNTDLISKQFTLIYKENEK